MASSSATDVVLPIPNLALPQYLFVLSTPSLSRLHDDARTQLLEGIEKDEMGTWYRSLTSATGAGNIPPNEELLKKLEATNTEALAKLDTRLKEAEETEGESEISDALRARANYLTKIGDKVGVCYLV